MQSEFKDCKTVDPLYLCLQAMGQVKREPQLLQSFSWMQSLEDNKQKMDRIEEEEGKFKTTKGVIFLLLAVRQLVGENAKIMILSLKCVE